MKTTKHNSRRDFLKLIPVAAISIGAFSFFRSKKHNQYSDENINKVSEAEANDIIKNEKFPETMHIKPSPPPDPHSF